MRGVGAIRFPSVEIVTAEAYAAIAETLPIGTVAVDPEIDAKGRAV
jgi:hypothetical protein